MVILLFDIGTIFLSAILLFASVLSPPPAFADDFELSPAVSEVGETFSDKYCVAISDGSPADQAALVAGRQMISSLMRSGALKKSWQFQKKIWLHSSPRIFLRHAEIILEFPS